VGFVAVTPVRLPLLTLLPPLLPCGAVATEKPLAAMAGKPLTAWKRSLV